MDIDLNDAAVKAVIDAEVQKRIDAEAGGLKTKNTQLMDELKGIQRKFDGVDPEEYKTLKAKTQKDGDKDKSPEELRARILAELQPDVEKAKQEAAEAKAALHARIIDGDLTSALVASNVAKDFMPAAAALLKSSQKIEVTESGATVDGKPLGEFIKGWVSTEGKPYVAAQINTGGGAGGGGNGGGAATDFSKMNATQIAKHVSENGYTPPTAQ